MASQPIYQFYAELKDYEPEDLAAVSGAGKHHDGPAGLYSDDHV